ncbi:alpha-N-acetylglucosaminidase [Streptomyces sp. AA4]|nr:alpha-N-acetylglucosaminidase [Streptomyces sp. AA4]
MTRAVLALTVAASALGAPGSAQAAPAFDTSAASAAVARVLPRQAAQFTLTPVQRRPSGDYFTVKGRAGKIEVQGTSPGVLLTGVNWYLKYTAKVDVSWPGDSLSRLPATLPAPSQPVTQSAVVPNRFALNDTDSGYSGPYKSWADYERQIDVLALHGVNEVFVDIGTDAVYDRTFRQFGYTADEVRSWIPSPGHQPWWLLQNMASFTGPVSPQLLDARVAMAKKVITRLKDLGMTPVLPGYFGTVPRGFADKSKKADASSDARVIGQGTWVGFDRPDWLDPRTSSYRKVAAAFYQAQHDLFGDTSMYKMDLLHEGGKSGDVPVGDAARGVMTALQTARPGATWVLLGWQNNPPRAIVDAVDKSKLFVVDGLSDRYGQRDPDSQWNNTPYAFGTIYNFGGHTTIGANTGVWTQRFPQWRTKQGSALTGIAYLPEGTGTNPAAFELFTELAWRQTPIHQAAWFADYASRRYGGPDTRAATAWDLLRQTAYSMPASGWSEAQDSLYAARPNLDAATAATWSPASLRYQQATFGKALDELLNVDPALRGTDAYRFDLVDVARQALTNTSRTLLPQIKTAYTNRDRTQFTTLTSRWMSNMTLLDKLLATDSRFLLGPWLEAAKSWAGTDTEQARLEYDARSLITTWGPRAGSDDGRLHDYANREWSGLVSDFYAKRWKQYFDSLNTAMNTGGQPASIDWFAAEDGWAKQRNPYPTTPAGDPYALAAQVRDTLAAASSPRQGAIVGIGGKCVDVTNGSSADGTPVQVWDCNGTAAQTWTAQADGTVRAMGKCLDVRGGATAAGTAVQLYGCNGTPAQTWTSRKDGTLVNTKSNLCLDATGGSSTPGTPLIVWTCIATPNQKWALPS